MNSIVIAAALVVAGIGAWLWFRQDAERSTQRQLKKAFRVSRRSRVLSRDVGPGRQATASRKLSVPRVLRADGLTGAPDALFLDRRTLIAGEYKSRKIRGAMRPREVYQVMLYLGMLKSLYPNAKVEGRLVYRDACRLIRFDSKMYTWLLTNRQATLDILNRAGR